MCLATVTDHTQELKKQWEIMEDLRVKFMAARGEEALDRYDAFLAAWRKFQQMRREL